MNNEGLEGLFVYNPEDNILPKKDIIRNKISMVADQPTLVGILSDVSAVTMYALTFLIKAIEESTTLDEVKEKISADLTPLAELLQTKITSGELKLPYLVKDTRTAGVVGDFIRVNNGVAEVLAEEK